MQQDRWWRKLLALAGTGDSTPAARKRTIPGLEALEEREMPSVVPTVVALSPPALGELSSAHGGGANQAQHRLPGEFQIVRTGAQQVSSTGQGPSQTSTQGNSHGSNPVLISMPGQGQMPGFFWGQLPAPGQGQLPTPGEGQLPAPGPGLFLTQGPGQLPAMGQLPAPGQGPVRLPGEFRIVTVGDQQLSTSGQGQSQTSTQGDAQGPNQIMIVLPGFFQGQFPTLDQGPLPQMGQLPAPGQGQLPGMGQLPAPGTVQLPAPGQGLSQLPAMLPPLAIGQLHRHGEFHLLAPGQATATGRLSSSHREVVTHSGHSSSSGLTLLLGQPPAHENQPSS